MVRGGEIIGDWQFCLQKQVLIEIQSLRRCTERFCVTVLFFMRLPGLCNVTWMSYFFSVLRDPREYRLDYDLIHPKPALVKAL